VHLEEVVRPVLSDCINCINWSDFGSGVISVLRFLALLPAVEFESAGSNRLRPLAVTLAGLIL